MISIEIIIKNLVDSLKILRTGYLQTLGRFGFFFVHNFLTRYFEGGKDFNRQSFCFQAN